MADEEKSSNLALIFFIIVLVIAVTWFVNGLMDLDDVAGKPVEVSENI